MSHLQNCSGKMFKEHCRYCKIKHTKNGVGFEPTTITGTGRGGVPTCPNNKLEVVSNYLKRIAGIVQFKKRGWVGGDLNPQPSQVIK